MPLPSRPRFHALTWGQFLGSLIIVGGMIPYWRGVGGAEVKEGITPRVITLSIVVAVTGLAPMLINVLPGVIRGLGGRTSESGESIADKAKWVRVLLWVYIYLDAALLTYLVHITGGISGSMYTGVYLMLPSVPILFKIEQDDIHKTRWFILACMFGVIFSYWMSLTHHVEFSASKHEQAFDLSLLIVTFSAFLIPLIEIVILHVKGEE